MRICTSAVCMDLYQICHWNEKRWRKSSCVSKCAQNSEINLHRQMLYYLVCMCVCLSMSVLVYVLCVCMSFLLGSEHYINPREAESVSMATHPSSIPPPVESEMKGFIRRKGKKAASDWKREISVKRERKLRDGDREEELHKWKGKWRRKGWHDE